MDEGRAIGHQQTSGRAGGAQRCPQLVSLWLESDRDESNFIPPNAIVLAVSRTLSCRH